MRLADHVTTLDQFGSQLAVDRHLAVLVTTSPVRADPQISVVNAALMSHPITQRPVLAFVARPGAKLTNLRVNPNATLVARAGWEWAAARGPVELVGPDDPHPHINDSELTSLLRRIYDAAGGRHPDMHTYDQAMLAERRCAVLMTPDHVWSNPPGSEHLEPSAPLDRLDENQEPQP